MHFNKFLTMRELESEELEEKLGWHTLIIGYKGTRRHPLFAMPTTLKLMAFLLRNWTVLVSAPGHKQLGIIWYFPLSSFKSEVVLELISKFHLTQILSAFIRVLALEGFFPTWPLDVCSSFCGGRSWPKQRQTGNAIPFSLEAEITLFLLAILLLFGPQYWTKNETN